MLFLTSCWILVIPRISSRIRTINKTQEYKNKKKTYKNDSRNCGIFHSLIFGWNLFACELMSWVSFDWLQTIELMIDGWIRDWFRNWDPVEINYNLLWCLMLFNEFKLLFNQHRVLAPLISAGNFTPHSQYQESNTQNKKKG